jgi:hypothetical protein
MPFAARTARTPKRLRSPPESGLLATVFKGAERRPKSVDRPEAPRARTQTRTTSARRRPGLSAHRPPPSSSTSSSSSSRRTSPPSTAIRMGGASAGALRVGMVEHVVQSGDPGAGGSANAPRALSAARRDAPPRQAPPKRRAPQCPPFCASRDARGSNAARECVAATGFQIWDRNCLNKKNGEMRIFCAPLRKDCIFGGFMNTEG